ncbi:MAG: hypothetical protein KAI17_01015, partial [Thiotrichaceae bacterium]|nr:hypothetical protein [Thiotrichaceae bacterium]
MDDSIFDSTFIFLLELLNFQLFSASSRDKPLGHNNSSPVGHFLILGFLNLILPGPNNFKPNLSVLAVGGGAVGNASSPKVQHSLGSFTGDFIIIEV